MYTGAGDRLRNQPFLQLLDLRNLDLDLGLGRSAYHCVSLIDLCLHTKFRFNRKDFLWTTGICIMREVAEWYGAGLAIGRSWVRLPPVAAV